MTKFTTLCAMLCILIVIGCIYNIVLPKSIESIAYSWGSTGDQVKKIQNKLKQWDYYDGAVDGIFGTGTSHAVKKFQSRNGLTPDGVVGTQTLIKLGMPVPGERGEGSSRNVSRDVRVMASAIHGEARGEPYVGKVAVGAVIINRTKDSRFPHTIAGVIYQPGAFTAVDDGQINLAPDEESIKAAKDALNGWDPTGGCVYYWNPATATSKWIWSRNIVTKIGDHYFGK